MTETKTLKKPKFEIVSVKKQADAEAERKAKEAEEKAKAEAEALAKAKTEAQANKFFYEMTGIANGSYDPEAGTFTCKWGTFPAVINKHKAAKMKYSVTRRGIEFVSGERGWVFYPCVGHDGQIQKVELVRFFNELFPAEAECIRAQAKLGKMDFKSQPRKFVFTVKRNDEEQGKRPDGKPWKKGFTVIGNLPLRGTKMVLGQKWRLKLTITPESTLAAVDAEMLVEAKPRKTRRGGGAKPGVNVDPAKSKPMPKPKSKLAKTTVVPFKGEQLELPTQS